MLLTALQHKSAIHGLRRAKYHQCWVFYCLQESWGVLRCEISVWHSMSAPLQPLLTMREYCVQEGKVTDSYLNLQYPWNEISCIAVLEFDNWNLSKSCFSWIWWPWRSFPTLTVLWVYDFKCHLDLIFSSVSCLKVILSLICWVLGGDFDKIKETLLVRKMKLWCLCGRGISSWHETQLEIICWWSFQLLQLVYNKRWKYSEKQSGRSRLAKTDKGVNLEQQKW